MNKRHKYLTVLVAGRSTRDQSQALERRQGVGAILFIGEKKVSGLEERYISLWSGDTEAKVEVVTGQSYEAHTGQKLESRDGSQLTLVGDSSENILLKSNGRKEE